MKTSYGLSDKYSHSIFMWCITVFLLVVVFPSHAALTKDKLKAALLINISKEITWPKSTSKEFILASYGESSLYDVLIQLDGIKHKNKVLKVIKTKNIDLLKKTQIVFFDAVALEEFNRLTEKLRKTSTLIVSNSLPDHRNTMIDFQELNQRITFLVHKSNVIFEQLSISPNLLLLGGSELDVATLYRETEQAYTNLKKENKVTLTLLNKNKSELKSVKYEVQEVKKGLLKKEQALLTLKQTLIQTQQQIIASKASLDYKKQEVEKIASLLKDSQHSFNVNLKAIKNQKLNEDQLNKQIVKQTNKLTELEADIKTKNLTLKKQLSELDSKQQTITIQNYLLVIVFIIVSLVAIAAAVIFKQYRKNKKMNKDLVNTLTLLRNTQKQLVESEKMASLGNLVTGVAHELNTPIGNSITCITNIGDQAHIIKQKIDSGILSKNDLAQFIETVIESDKLIVSGLQRCSELIQNFKQVSADQVVAEPRIIKIKDYINEIMSTLSIKLKREGVILTVSGENPDITLDPGIIAQVLTNLTINSIKHGFKNIEKKSITINISKIEEQVKVDFTDNGIGMKPEVIKKVFDPFFTTARGNGGTGLGMNIVYNLISAKLGGRIDINSEVNVGTTISMVLPLYFKPQVKNENEDGELFLTPYDTH